MILGINGIIAGRGADADALAFITAANITDSTQKSAVNQLVTDLKSANIWTKMKAIYPFVGGTASQHRFNLKDPRTVSGAFYLDFYGGGTHSANGYQPDGATAYADTKLIPNNSLTARDTHLSVYSRQNTVAFNYRMDIGAANLNTAVPLMTLSAKYNSLSEALSDQYSLTANRILINNNDSRGLYISSRTSINSHKLYKNTSLLASDTVNDTINLTPSYVVTIGALNFANTITQFSDRELAFASIGNGLSDSEVTALYNAVNAYQVALSRNV